MGPDQEKKDSKEKEFNRQVAKELQVERWMKQVTQQTLADRMETTKSAVSRLEKGEQNISMETAAKYAYALGMEPKFVLKVQEPIGLYAADTDYCLKLFDEDLVRFSMKMEYGLQVHILWVNEEKKHLMPIGMDLTDEGLTKWLRRRTIPKNRAYVEEILWAYKLTVNDTKDILDLCKGLSLNDSYWVVPAGFGQTFDECNLYDHDFLEILSVIAYTGAPYSLKKEITSTPEFTTNGMLRKAWRNKGEKGIWLYKGGTEDFANAGNEPFSEVLAYQVAKRMELNAIPYELENWKGILASKCKLFTNRYFSFVPTGRVVKEGGIPACLAYYKTLGQEFVDQLCSMLVFDALIYNEDRHYGNFGLLRDNRTGKFVAPAPIFDSGISLFCYAMKKDFDRLEDYAATRTPPYGMSFEDVCRMVMGPLQKEQLRRMINFRFEDLEPVSLPAWRIRAIEEQLQRRVQQLMAL